MATNSATDSTWDDPCATYKALRACYMRLISGTQESEVEYLNLGVTRRVRYSQANISELKAAMNLAQGECEALNSGYNPNRRFAITAGSRRAR